MRKKQIFMFSIIFLIFLIIWKNVSLTYVVGRSMAETISPGDVLIIDKTYSDDEMVRGDICVFDIKIDGELQRVIKRVIGVSGDSIEFLNGDIYINGSLLEENYLAENYTKADDEKLKVPNGAVFVLGDNRKLSMDSRSKKVGFIDFEESIYGKVINKFNK